MPKPARRIGGSSAVWRLAPLALLLAAPGCAADDPYTNDRRAPSTQHHHGKRPLNKSPQTASGAPESGELAGRAPPELLDEPTEFHEAGETPQATLALAGRLYGNWTSATASRQLRRIAELSVGQARAELSQTAAQARVDGQQRGARSRASVEAISVRGQGPHRRGLVVTREQVRAPDLPFEGRRYQVTVAALERRPDGWVISRWAPQP